MAGVILLEAAQVPSNSLTCVNKAKPPQRTTGAMLIR